MNTVLLLFVFLAASAAQQGLGESALEERPSVRSVAVKTGVQYFPALNYGHNRWTSIRVENFSAVSRSVEIEAYRDDGSSMDAIPLITLKPKEKTEIRLADKGKAFRWCWAKITTDSAEVSITVTIEVLQGNRVEQFERESETPSSHGRWINSSSDAVGKQLYYLNTSTDSTVLTFCQADNPRVNCDHVKPKFGVSGRRSVVLNMNRRMMRPYVM